jgi:hypothetical protein
LACASSSICLLENALATTFFVEATNESKEEGCYLYYDRPQCVWIRSGKVIGRTLLVRHKEHHKSSKLQTTKDYESKFYRTYPSIEALSQMGNHAYCRHGTFEKLQLFSGLTFSRERNTEFLISNSGIFNWPDELLKNIEKVNFAGTRSIKEKQLHMGCLPL